MLLNCPDSRCSGQSRLFPLVMYAEVRRGEGPGERRCSSDGGKVLRAGFAHQGSGLHEVLEVLLDVLVVDVELFFQGVEFRVLEDLPPFSAQHRVRRLRYLPAIIFLKLRGRFLVNRGCWSGRRMVLGPD